MRRYELSTVIAGQPGPAFDRPGCKLDPAIHHAFRQRQTFIRLTLVTSHHGCPGLSREDALRAKDPGMTEYVVAPMHTLAGNFSVGRLMEFLAALGQDLAVTVKPTRKRVGEMEVVGS